MRYEIRILVMAVEEEIGSRANQYAKKRLLYRSILTRLSESTLSGKSEDFFGCIFSFIFFFCFFFIIIVVFFFRWLWQKLMRNARHFQLCWNLFHRSIPPMYLQPAYLPNVYIRYVYAKRRNVVVDHRRRRLFHVSMNRAWHVRRTMPSERINFFIWHTMAEFDQMVCVRFMHMFHMRYDWVCVCASPHFPIHKIIEDDDNNNNIASNEHGIEHSTAHSANMCSLFTLNRTTHTHTQEGGKKQKPESKVERTYAPSKSSNKTRKTKIFSRTRKKL